MDVRDRILIGGQWVPSAGTGLIDVVDPSTEQVVGRVPDGVPADVDAAVAAARAAFPAWADTSAQVRAQWLARLAESVREHSGELADLMSAEMGAPLKIAKLVQVGAPLGVLDSYVALADDLELESQVNNSLVVKEPVGVVGMITPWNYPLYQVIAKVAPALLAGCTMVLKPSEVAPLAVYRLAELITDLGLPPGVVNLVSGVGPVVGAAIAAHPGLDMVSFTGSTAAGRLVAAAASASVKRVALELGGKSASVLLPDLDGAGLARAVKGTISQAYLNTGQRCSAFSRLLVPAGRLAEVEYAAKETAESYAVGSPQEPGVKLGPVVSAAQRERVNGFVDRAVSAGARLVTGGSKPPSGREVGFFVQPTILSDVTEGMEVAQQEVFGPVVAIMTYTDVDDAVRLANSTAYGLAGGVWGADPDVALAVARRLRAGQVDVNGGAFNPAAPFGGYGQSGNGRELGREGLEEYLETKAIQL
jgi:acyl-CoA reductase-like NAD-dependent aldehyde dehydrogenase